MGAATGVRWRPWGERLLERVAAGLLLVNAVFLVAVPYFCPLAIRSNLASGGGFYAACSMALSRPLFPLVFFLAALEAVQAAMLWWAGSRVRRWVLLRAALGVLG